MSLTTVPVTCIANDAAGNPIQGALFTFELVQKVNGVASRIADIYQGFVPPDVIEGVTGADGSVIVQLFPNELGIKGTQYQVTATNPEGAAFLKKVLATVPNHACNLHEIMEVAAPADVSFATSVRAVALAGLSLLSATAVTADDTVLGAVGKLQAQVTANSTSLSGATGSASVGFQQAGANTAVRTVQARLRDVVSFADYTTAAAADANGSPIYVPAGTWAATAASGAALNGRYYGPGRIQTADGNKRAKYFSTLKSAPTALGDHNGIDTCFNGDLSGQHFSIEHRITGAATLGQPVAGFAAVPEACPIYGVIRNASGWNQSTSGNDGRTMVSLIRGKVFHAGQGGTNIMSGTIVMSSTPNPLNTNFLANAASCVYTGDYFCTTDGNFMDAFEVQFHDQGHDCAAAGYVKNFERNNGTGANWAWWVGDRVQSIGTAPIDVVWSASGKANMGIDFSMLTLTSAGTYINAAIVMKQNQRIWFKATGADPSGMNRFSDGLGDSYITHSSGINGLTFVVANSSILQLTGAQATITTPAHIGTSGTDYLRIAGSVGTATLETRGASADVNLTYLAKGTGSHIFQAAGGTQFEVLNTATAVNYVQITGSATGAGVRVQAAGTDANVNLTLRSRGAGIVSFISNGAAQAFASGPANAVNTVSLSGATTGNGVIVAASGSDANVDLILTPRGTGKVTTAAQISATGGFAGALTGNVTGNVTGNLTGSVTGNVTGDVTGNISGNAGTATKLFTAWSINGVPFDGSADITVAAAASTLTGTTLAAGVTTSSLTSVGTLTALVVAGLVNLGDDGVNDYLQVQGTAGFPQLKAQGPTADVSPTYISKGTGAHVFQTNGGGTALTQFKVGHVANAVNFVQIAGSATGAGVQVQAQGTDATVNLVLAAKSTGIVIGQSNGANQVSISGPASAVNRLDLQGSTGTNAVIINAAGTATNIDIKATPKGTGNLTSSTGILALGTAGMGYGTGAGGTVAQATSKATGVTLNKACGQVTMNNAALAAGAKVSFVVTNSVVAATDIPKVAVVSGGTANAYRADVTAVAAGSFTVTVENLTAGSLSETPVIGFAITKAVTA